MKARQPDQCGYAVNDGVRIYYEVHGSGPRTVVLLPTWQIVDSGVWKMQVPYLSRHARVVTYDARGNGRSDRPQEPEAYAGPVVADDLRAVLDATETDRAVLVAYCDGSKPAVLVARDDPHRVSGMVALAPDLLGVETPSERRGHSFDRSVPEDAEPVGWETESRAYWKRNWQGYVEWFMENVASEPHSTKLYDDLVGWGLQTDASTMLATMDAPEPFDTLPLAEQAVRDLRCPMLVIVGDQDKIVAPACSRRWAEITGADMLVIEDGGHAPAARHPVVVNEAVLRFLDRVEPPPPAKRRWHYARTRPQRALWISSPIGLGHVLRDLAIAREVRARVPGLQVDWLAQSPVTEVLRAAGEHIHPASQDLASESAHWESEASGHGLHAFYAFRRMDEILLANYMVFDDLTRETPYDLWVGDECWDVDYYLHENPERKTAPYVFTTDVVGFLPVSPDTDPREADLCADYNAQMIEHRARFPRLRDASLFIGGYDELPDASLGTGLPTVRDWTRDWFDSVPYVVPFDPTAYQDADVLRGRLGHGSGYPLLVAAVGGTAVGMDLLHLVAEGFRYLRKEVPEARMLMVTGPRIDPSDVPDVEGMTKQGFVPNLFEHLAACDAAVVQGGLSTTMELTALGRPFVYFPLEGHWEQRHFVSHRLDHYRAGTRMEFADTTPLDLAGALQHALARQSASRPVPAHGARAAADRIVPLLRR
jgi:pimeloyl-ACP methyl ester carboxylesterase/UDP:flavonoid glycosyltransferase YjiC (YdhE family)